MVSPAFAIDAIRVTVAVMLAAATGPATARARPTMRTAPAAHRAARAAVVPLSIAPMIAADPRRGVNR